MQKQFSY